MGFHEMSAIQLFIEIMRSLYPQSRGTKISKLRGCCWMRSAEEHIAKTLSPFMTGHHLSFIGPLSLFGNLIAVFGIYWGHLLDAICAGKVRKHQPCQHVFDRMVEILV